MKNLQKSLRIQQKNLEKLIANKNKAWDEFEDLIFSSSDIDAVRKASFDMDYNMEKIVVVKERIKRIKKNIEIKQREIDKELEEQKRIANREVRAISMHELKFKNLNEDDFELIYERENNSATTEKYEIFKNSFKLKDQELFDAIGFNWGGSHQVYANAEYAYLYVS